MLDSPADLLDRLCLASPPIYLCPAGDAEFDAVADRVIADRTRICNPSGACRQRMRPRTYKRHLPLQHVNKLRQLVQARHPEKAADSGDPRVSGPRELVAKRIGLLHVHRAEFQQVEWEIVGA